MIWSSFMMFIRKFYDSPRGESGHSQDSTYTAAQPRLTPIQIIVPSSITFTVKIQDPQSLYWEQTLGDPKVGKHLHKPCVMK